MDKPREFSFGDLSVAAAYDRVLVPMLFVPWAEQLVEEFQPWNGKSILDLATGTGVLAERLAGVVGELGKVTGIDINPEMLAMAAQRCAGANPPVEFMEATAESLDLADESMDVVVCQQGFQFFPDKPAAATELHRVLRRGGTMIVTTWCPVEECEFFGAICEALIAVGEVELADMMRVPFDHMPSEALQLHFEAAGFANVRMQKQQRLLELTDAESNPVQVVYATPIGPKLGALEGEKQADFKDRFMGLIDAFSEDGRAMGSMTSHVLSAHKA